MINLLVAIKTKGTNYEINHKVMLLGMSIILLSIACNVMTRHNMGEYKQLRR